MNFSLTSREEEIAWAKNVAEFVAQHGDDEAAKEIDLLIQEYDQRKIIVSVIGLNKRGKSTLCNALLGRNDDILAPVNWKPATGVVSQFSNLSAVPSKYGKSASGDAVRAFVCFEDGSHKEISCESVRDYALEERNPENQKNVEQIEIYGNFAMDKDIMLQDLPGDDSIYAYHSQIVYRYLPNADIVLFLSSATQPIQQSELDLLRKVADGDRRKVFFVINKSDECDAEELEQAKEHTQKVLQNAGISIEKRIFCISALQMMKDGKDEFEFSQMAQEISDYLKQNKLELLQEGFRNAVRNVASELSGKLSLQISSSKMNEEEVQKNIVKLKEDREHCQKILDSSLQEFEGNWKGMIDDFARQLPGLEKVTREKVREYIANIPMMSLNDKVAKALSAKITEIMELEFQTPLAALQEGIKNNLEKLGQEIKDIDKYLSDNAFILQYVKDINLHGGSVLTGMGFIGIGAVLMKIVAAPAALSSIPFVGGLLAGAASTALAPLMFVATPLIAGGALFLALPVMGWLRGKRRIKSEILQSADNEVVKAFAAIRTTKLELMRNQGSRLCTEVERDFTRKMTQCKTLLEEAQEQKRRMIGEGNGKVLEADAEILNDLLNAKA